MRLGGARAVAASGLSWASAAVLPRPVDGIRWRVRVGAPWRDVPERYGPWQSV
ncbi:transposase [Isoptericola sp. NEAU-Y5]|uniref:Transposase n=1 Tax=Isoptericola luteus TaxID=2879484 RepID=A0ABS7ZJE9_9MICO|nr:transposase [Isoptericola sp. NEAU-Y5]